MAPQNVYQLLERNEGRKPRLYYVPNPRNPTELVPHIAIGFNLKDGPDLPDDIIDALLHYHVSLFNAQLAKRVAGWRRMSDARQAVFTDVAFQCGVQGLMGFVKMLQAAAIGDWPVAARELLDSDLAHQNVNRTALLAESLRRDTLL